MTTPPLSGNASRVADMGDAASQSVEPSPRVLSGARPAADWICVAAARNVLIVDDNDRHLDILSTILASVGHDVETCGSGAEALRRLDARRYDIVVLDLVMPEVSGGVVAYEIGNCALNRQTPVIICTANIAQARRQLADAPGIAAIIGKPIDAATLILAVAKAPIRERSDRRRDQIRI